MTRAATPSPHLAGHGHGFYNAMRCGGVDEIKAKIMYYAVYHFGPPLGNGTAASNLLSSKHPYSVETTSNLLDTTTSQQAGMKASDAVEWIKNPESKFWSRFRRPILSSPTGDQTHSSGRSGGHG